MNKNDYINLIDYIYYNYYFNSEHIFNKRECLNYLINDCKLKKKFLKKDLKELRIQNINIIYDEIFDYLNKNNYLVIKNKKNKIFKLEYDGALNLQTILNNRNNNITNILSIIILLISTCISMIASLYDGRLAKTIQFIGILIVSICIIYILSTVETKKN